MRTIIQIQLDRCVEKLSRLGLRDKKFLAQIFDALLVLIALAAAHLLRLSVLDLSQIWPLFVLVPIATVFAFTRAGVYKAVIRYSGSEGFAPLARGVVLSAIFLLIVQSLLAPDPNSRSIFVIYGMVLLFMCVGARHVWKNLANGGTGGVGAPIAIYGAGALGRQVMQICRTGLEYRPVVWLDDNPKYHGRELANLTVLDPTARTTPSMLRAKGVETILMAIPSLSGVRLREVLELLRHFDCSIRTLPSIEDIMANRVTSSDTRELPLEELIGREPVAPDMTLMIKNVTGKVVMVTGAGGSVGSELCRQILPLRPSALVLFDVSEAAMYQIEQGLIQLNTTLSEGQNCPDIRCVIGNVTRKPDICRAIERNGVQTLFHAAAYKHVPMVEKNPQPAVRTNIGGTLTTLEAAISFGVESFLLISTDKAVRPTNIMGATKRVAEMVVQAKAAQDNVATSMSIVRFGNVIGSSGSVVPKFSEQIVSGGPVTVTHKDIVRYFMSIPEAAQLVIQASALAEGGDVFLLDMGAPVQIADLAKSLIFLHGKTLKDENNPNGEIEIKYTGLRAGEKLYEELLIDEDAVMTTHPKISRAREAFLPWPELQAHLQKLDSEMRESPGSNMVSLLQAVVPGYRPDARTVSLGVVSPNQHLPTP